MNLLIYVQRVGAAVTGAVVGTPAKLSDAGTPMAAVASMVMSKALCEK